MDYGTIGLNEKLRPLDISLKKEGVTTGYEFNYKTERGAVRSPSIQSEAIGTSEIADGAVTTSKIAAGAVSEAKIASYAITSSKLGTAAVGSVNIAGSAINTTHIVGSAITNEKINDFAFSKGTGAINVTSGTISGVLLGTAQITGGTANNQVVGTPNITGGTTANQTIGTPSLSGGTLNPGVYQASGTAGATGTAVYIKTITGGTASAWGTIITNNGLVLSIN
jgi:hypothetical protein